MINRLNTLPDTAYPLTILAIALFLDYCIGDPWTWVHPVQVIGWWINHISRISLNTFQHPLTLKIAGIVLGLSTILGTGLLSWLLLTTIHHIHPLLGLMTESMMLASCFAGRSLRDAATDVLTPLQNYQITEARKKMALYVGRDTQALDEPELLRAILETVTENATDGVLAPLFYAILGIFLNFFFPLGITPLVLAYKAASTLDSMIGYKTSPYTNLGWFSARLEDALTWIPCRLVVGTIALLSGKPQTVWNICQRDAPHDPSPNAGWSECSYAAALGIQLGGTNLYQGVTKAKPLLGDRLHPLSPDHVSQALRLTRRSIFVWMAIAILMLIPFLDSLPRLLNLSFGTQ